MAAPSYVELCIQALPPEKQAAARTAFKDLLEGAPDDSMLSRLLIVLEATAAYGKTIPSEIATTIEKILPALDARLAKIAQVAGNEDVSGLKQVRELLEKKLATIIPAVPMERNARAVESLRLSVERLERGVRRLRHLRLGAVALLMLLSAGAGAGGVIAYFRKDYNLGQRNREYFEYLDDHGISTKIESADSGGLVFQVEGRQVLKGTDWLNDEHGHAIGVKFIYPFP